MFRLVSKDGTISIMSIVHLCLRTLYRGVAITGFPSTRVGQWTYVFIFSKFKLLTEGNMMREVCNYIKPGSLVIDVGANIGFCTKFFLNHIVPEGKVVAIEPEQLNLRSLCRQFSAKIKAGNLVVIDKVVADKSGNYYLHIDPCNPGGHVMAPRGIPVKGITIDQIVSQIGLVPSLIKIDVEGYEELVIFGANETISKHHPILFIEFHPGLLTDRGTDPIQLLQKLANLNYRLLLFGKNGRFYESSIEQTMIESEVRHWLDILLVPKTTEA